MKTLFVTVLVLPILLFSCSPPATNMVTSDLSKSDYTDVITVPGSIQAVNTVNIMAPMNYFGDMTVQWAIPEGTQVEQGDTVCILECIPLKKMLDEELKNLEILHADFKKLEADNAMNLALLNASLRENEAAKAINQLDSVQIRYAPENQKKVMSLNLEKSGIEERKLRKKADSEKKIDETEIRQMKSRILQAENRVRMYQEQVNNLTVMAPKSGIVSRSLSKMRMYISFGDGSDMMEMGGYPKKGSRFFPEMPIMSMPDLTEMQVAVQVMEADYKRIEKGQAVDIVVDAAGGLRTTGSVKKKSLAGQSDYYTNSKVKWYEIVIAVDSCHSRMPLAFTARCDLYINRIRDTVVVPTLSIFERDSMKVVYVADGDKFRPVQVETGLTNSSQTIISHGLTGNETISLLEPPLKLIEKPNTKIHE